MELLNERWAPVLGYEGRYEVSDYGRIRSLTRWRRGKFGCLVPVQGRAMRLQQKKRSANGRTLPYFEIRLRDGSPRDVRSKVFLVHRLVAQAFVGELFEGAQVDHIDGDHGNNHCPSDYRDHNNYCYCRRHCNYHHAHDYYCNYDD